MTRYLITGPAGFLGFHVAKLLNERGERPRVLVTPGVDPASAGARSLAALDTERIDGDYSDSDSLRAACTDIDVVLHLDFVILFGAGEETERRLHDGNVLPVRAVIDAAVAAGVSRVVVSSSALALGLNREPTPLAESADWQTHAFHLPYAQSRREAEQEALSRSTGDVAVVAVNPTFTMGPEDHGGAPANALASRLTSKWFRINPPIGFSVLDVRDYAAGVLGAAERGEPGTRYVLSAANLDAPALTRAVAAVAGLPEPKRYLPVPLWLVRPIVGTFNGLRRLRGKPPAVAPALLELFGRHAWYDSARARSTSTGSRGRWSRRSRIR